jgi:FkbM family methyltransferase
VVDCGANCAHFSLLVEECLKAKFGHSDAHFILIEPNPDMLKIIDRTVKTGGFHERCKIVHGALCGDSDAGTTRLFRSKKNYLAASTNPRPDTQSIEVPIVFLDDCITSESIDILKVDIEGAEFAWLPTQQSILSKTKTLFIEIHNDSLQEKTLLLDFLKNSCFVPMQPLITHGEHCLGIFRRTQDSHPRS